jgi:hypothetical protein
LLLLLPLLLVSWLTVAGQLLLLLLLQPLELATGSRSCSPAAAGVGLALLLPKLLLLLPLVTAAGCVMPPLRPRSLLPLWAAFAPLPSPGALPLPLLLLELLLLLGSLSTLAELVRLEGRLGWRCCCCWCCCCWVAGS